MSHVFYLYKKIYRHIHVTLIDFPNLYFKFKVCVHTRKNATGGFYPNTVQLGLNRRNFRLVEWNEGCHESLVLFAEIQKQGYKGSYDTVARSTRRILTAQGIKPLPAFRRFAIAIALILLSST